MAYRAEWAPAILSLQTLPTVCLQGSRAIPELSPLSTFHLASCACLLSQGSGPSKFLKGCRDEVLGIRAHLQILLWLLGLGFKS